MIRERVREDKGDRKGLFVLADVKNSVELTKLFLHDNVKFTFNPG